MVSENNIQWAAWLQKTLDQKLQGTFIRPLVELKEAVYREDEKEPWKAPKIISPERMEISFTMPLEWRISHILTPEELTLEKAMELTLLCKVFATEVWQEEFSTQRQIELFRTMPGKFEFYSERTPQILYRLTRIMMEKEFGPKNFRKIVLYEDCLIVHMRSGPFYIGYDNYRERLEEVIRTGHAFMRKPIRYQFLKELRKSIKHDTETDKNKG